MKMKVYKFGGASVKDPAGVKNVARVLQNQGFKSCVLIVSAMGKTTNALENAVAQYFAKGNWATAITVVKDQHLDICTGLFEQNSPVFSEIEDYIEDLTAFLNRNQSPSYDFVYDQVVSCGEMMSSIILSEYLKKEGLDHQWLDSRDYIKTDDNYREGTVNWEETEKRIQVLNKEQSYLTQGFTGSDSNRFTTTLGREGSDYSAAIFAYCLNAESMTIWKDVPGVMTGDPRIFEHVSLLSHISYEEAIEMAYYGASVIHPKTLQPLKQKNIPFFVKSFIEDDKPGTKISVTVENEYKESYILKKEQIMLKISTQDFSFIAENHISYIFKLLHKYRMKVSLMQNSAISLALCLEDKYIQRDMLLEDLNRNFRTELKENLSLFTVRNAKTLNVDQFFKNEEVLLEQITNHTIQMVLEKQ